MKMEYLDDFLDISKTLNVDIEQIISEFTLEEVKLCNNFIPTDNQSYKAYLNVIKKYIVDYSNKKFEE